MRPRLSRIYYAGKFYAYPLKAFEALRNLGLAQSIRSLASYVYARALSVREPKTFHHWMRNHFGERLFSIFFKTYTEQVRGMDCDEIIGRHRGSRGSICPRHSPISTLLGS
jgi:protoporphyrinogen oxidase